jgi:hypothetical protein
MTSLVALGLWRYLDEEWVVETRKYRDLSTARRTMKLSVASVEMTFLGGWI